MELEEIKEETEEKKEITKEERENLFNAIVRGQDLTEEIETSRGKFKIKFPRVRDIEKIGKILAARTSGLPVASFDPGFYTLMNQVATLDVLVLSGPSWYENAKTENKHGFTWNEIPDQDFIQEVYLKVFEFRNETQELLKPNKKEEDTGLVTDINTDDSDGPSLFEGLSGSL